MPIARSILIWFFLVVALVGAACTQPSDGGAGGASAPVVPVASQGAPAATGGLDGY